MSSLYSLSIPDDHITPEDIQQADLDHDWAIAQITDMVQAAGELVEAHAKKLVALREFGRYLRDSENARRIARMVWETAQTRAAQERGGGLARLMDEAYRDDLWNRLPRQ